MLIHTQFNIVNQVLPFVIKLYTTVEAFAKLELKTCLQFGSSNKENRLISLSAHKTIDSNRNAESFMSYFYFILVTSKIDIALSAKIRMVHSLHLKLLPPNRYQIRLLKEIKIST